MIAARVAFIARWNVARAAKLEAYRANDRAWHAAIDAGFDVAAAIELRERAHAAADAIEAAELDLAVKEYAAARGALESARRE